jgi:hypothetical protein
VRASMAGCTLCVHIYDGKKVHTELCAQIQIDLFHRACAGYVRISLGPDLVELVDAHHTAVGEHHRPALQEELACRRRRIHAAAQPPTRTRPSTVTRKSDSETLEKRTQINQARARGARMSARAYASARIGVL